MSEGLHIDRLWLNCAAFDEPRKDKLTWSQASTRALGLFRFKDPENVPASLTLHQLHLPVPSQPLFQHISLLFTED